MRRRAIVLAVAVAATSAGLAVGVHGPGISDADPTAGGLPEDCPATDATTGDPHTQSDESTPCESTEAGAIDSADADGDDAGHGDGATDADGEDGVQTPAEGPDQTPPTDGDEPPITGEQGAEEPADGADEPADGADEPVDAGDDPADGADEAAAGGQEEGAPPDTATQAEGAPAPAEQDTEPPDAPDDGDLADGDTTPADGDGVSPGDGDGAPAGGDAPAQGDEPDGGPASPAEEPGAVPTDGAATPGDGTAGTPGDGAGGTAGDGAGGTPVDGGGTPGDGVDGVPGNQTGQQPSVDESEPAPTQAEPVAGEPDLNAFAPNRTVEPGESRQLAVSVVNSGIVEDGGTGTDPDAEDAVTTARNVRATLTEDDAPVSVESGTVPLGDLRSGAVSRADFGIDVDEDADPGTYDLDAEIEYEYTEEIDVNESDAVEESDTVQVELVVTETGRFAVESVDAGLQVGEQGTVELDLENQGDADLTEATVEIRSRTRGLLVDGSGGQPGADAPVASRFVGEWGAGDDVSVSFAATPTNRSRTQEYALEAVVRYVDPDGDQRRSRPLSFGVTPDEEQAFSLDDLGGDLEVDDDGTIEGEITNEGPGPATDAVVRVVRGGDVATESDVTAERGRETGDGGGADRGGRFDETVVAQRSSAFLGDLDSGEDADFELPVRVTEDAEPGELSVRLVVEYLNADGDPRASRELRGAVEIDEEDEAFALEDVDSDLQVGADGTVSLSLSNEAGDDLTEARVSLTSRSDALRIDGGTNASRFVGEWDDGDEETVEFDATVANDSAVAEYPLTVRVAYVDGDGDEQRSDPIRTGVSPDDEQTFEFGNLTASLRVGDQGSVSGQVLNAGPRNVSNAALVVDTGDDAISAERSTVPLGDLSVNDTAAFDYPFEVSDDAEPGPRQFRLAVEYETDDGDRLRSDRRTVPVDVSARRDGFAVTDVDAPVQVEDSGTVTLSVRNRRGRAVTDARVDLRSNAGVLSVDGGENGTRFVGEWGPGETRTVQYELRAENGSAAQTYAVSASVAYEDRDGDDRESDPIRFGIEPRPEQAFALENVTSRLRVAEEGTVEGRLVNDGPGNATAALVRLETDTETTNPQESEYAVGSLEPGASRSFSFPVEITSDAEPTPRLFEFRVEYADADGDRTRSDRLTARVPVRPERDRFAVRAVDASIVRGETEGVALVVRNVRNETLRNVNAKVFVDDPLDTDDEAFVPVLEPNESVRLAFDVSAAGDASTGTVPLRADFEYELPDGDSELSDTYQVGVNVTDPPDDGLIDRLWPLAIVTALSLSGALVGRRYWRE
ncbi:hypothetical protein [Halorientalis halophila]|uniref:hypothetical protein n=1 Tax=Halorientalis halophila TaxID=3108499 RepID=UPI0030086E3D